MDIPSERPHRKATSATPGPPGVTFSLTEGDLIIGKNNASAIGTLVERATRFVLLVHLPDGYKAEQARDGLIKTITTLPRELRRSLTWDQGGELARHAEIRLATDMDIYFCDPGSPWQRGSNENTNGLLRQYFQRAPTCPLTPPPTCVASPLSSTAGHARPSAGATPPSN